ncbi:MAG: ribonucleoside-diphosphate reductase subunit alpha [Flavobacteriales bacterium]|nr:ribonucleoside-diphosphate reductase subunit alpha [Flavobacteriales bacterium]|tara:strand:+ start:6846 stop:9341 length:2496 start_codon:yes stop_codon:yes gene_type:complete
MSVQEMRVMKRNGSYEDISFDKILKRVKNLGNNMEPKLKLNYSPFVMDVIEQLYPDISTTKIDELTAEQCASLCTKHPDYGLLASRIIVSNNHKNTLSSFSDTMEKLYNFKDVHDNNIPIIDQKVWEIIKNNKDFFDSIINYDRDYEIDYFGFKTLERAYLMRVNKVVVERPQHMWLRVSIGIHFNDLESVKQTYDLMSQKYFTHATPTLYNAGTPRPQLSSCYLLSMEDDSIDGIYNTLKECANISKWAGGIGLHIHNVRATGSHIRGTNGTSNGIVPMLQVFNKTARYVDQGGGKRNGSFAIYLEPWHGDIEDFLDLKKNHGDEELRARDLFYALWIPSLFMEKVEKDLEWCLFCPDKCPGLSDCYGEKFNALYMKYESENKMIKKIKARDLWYKILDSQMETGTPYLLYKDSANEKSNQKNLGVIKSSNLCTEIIEYSNDNETAVCNLASIGLSKFVNDDKTFNHEKLHEVTKVITGNLNKIIDVNFYPTEKTQRSNYLHRPIGIGVQGLADTFAMMDVAFHSDEAKQINKDIFETIYHGALEKSNEMAVERQMDMKILQSYKDNDIDIFTSGDKACREYIFISENDKEILERIKPIRGEIYASGTTTLGSYSSFVGSPASQGILQFDMWGVTPSDRYDWTTLKTSIKAYGLRNSLLLAPMPTASTSQILGNNECFEPYTSNIYTRRTLAGDFVVANKHLMQELVDLGIWNEELKDNIIINKGSIQQIDGIPDKIKEKYKIVWEIPMKHLIDMSVDRGAFICQSQSLNLWQEDPSYKTLTAMHFYAWKKGLKTGIYYLRRKPKHQPQQFTIDPTKLQNNDEICEHCSA